MKGTLKRLSDTFSIELGKDMVEVEPCIKDIELLLSYGSEGVTLVHLRHRWY